MATMTIRNLDDHVKQELRKRRQHAAFRWSRKFGILITREVLDGDRRPQGIASKKSCACRAEPDKPLDLEKGARRNLGRMLDER